MRNFYIKSHIFKNLITDSKFAGTQVGEKLFTYLVITPSSHLVIFNTDISLIKDIHKN